MIKQERLILARSGKGLTQQQMADLIPISRPHYTNIENGLRRPGVKVAQRIAYILDLDWTLFYEDNEVIH